jgi:hypothetical protein
MHCIANGLLSIFITFQDTPAVYAPIGLGQDNLNQPPYMTQSHHDGIHPITERQSPVANNDLTSLDPSQLRRALLAQKAPSRRTIKGICK